MSEPDWRRLDRALLVWLEQGRANVQQQQRAAQLLREQQSELDARTTTLPWLAFGCGILTGFILLAVF